MFACRVAISTPALTALDGDTIINLPIGMIVGIEIDRVVTSYPHHESVARTNPERSDKMGQTFTQHLWRTVIRHFHAQEMLNI